MFAEPTHVLNDRKIDPKKALARGGRDPIKKVFVGGLPPEFPLEDIKEYFGKFGRVSYVSSEAFGIVTVINIKNCSLSEC